MPRKTTAADREALERNRAEQQARDDADPTPSTPPGTDVDRLVASALEAFENQDSHYHELTLEEIIRITLGAAGSELRNRWHMEYLSMDKALRALHAGVDSGKPHIPDHGAPVFCPGCAKICTHCRTETGERAHWPCRTVNTLRGCPPDMRPPACAPVPCDDCPTCQPSTDHAGETAGDRVQRLIVEAGLAAPQPDHDETIAPQSGLSHLRFPDGAEDYQYDCPGGCAGWATSGHKTAASATAEYEQHVREVHQ